MCKSLPPGCPGGNHLQQHVHNEGGHSHGWGGRVRGSKQVSKRGWMENLLPSSARARLLARTAENQLVWWYINIKESSRHAWHPSPSSFPIPIPLAPSSPSRLLPVPPISPHAACPRPCLHRLEALEEEVGRPPCLAPPFAPLPSIHPSVFPRLQPRWPHALPLACHASTPSPLLPRSSLLIPSPRLQSVGAGK